MERVVVVGSAGHAKVVIDILRCQARYEIAGLIDSFRPVGDSTAGLPVLGTEEALPDLVQRHGLAGMIVAVGDNHGRCSLVNRLEALCPDLPFVSAIHPSAVIAASSELGAGTVVAAGATINPDVRIGRHCIINTQASLDHDTQVGDFASVAPGAIVSGRCAIGAHSAVCVGSVVLQGLAIGEHTVIGAGSLVTRSIGDRVVAYGRPARIVRDRRPGDPYL